MKEPVLFWQSYGCGCTSATVTEEKLLPKKCPKHDYEYLQRYISRVNRPTVEQIDDNEKAAGVTHQNQMVARYPEPVL